MSIVWYSCPRCRIKFSVVSENWNQTPSKTTSCHFCEGIAEKIPFAKIMKMYEQETKIK